VASFVAARHCWNLDRPSRHQGEPSVGALRHAEVVLLKRQRSEERGFAFGAMVDRMCILQVLSGHCSVMASNLFKSRANGILTIAIDRAMGTWLSAVTFDLFPSTFIASSGHATAFLSGNGGPRRLTGASCADTRTVVLFALCLQLIV